LYQEYYEDCAGSYPQTTTNAVDPIEWPNPFLKQHYVSASVTNGPNYDEESGWTYTSVTAPTVQNQETYFDLVTSGPTNSGGTTLWLITITAYENYSESEIDPSTITILGETPDAYGRVLKLVANNSTNDATPSFAGLPSNHEVLFEISADAMRLGIEDSNSQDITGITTNNWVGQRVNNTATLSGEDTFTQAGYTVVKTNYAWTVASNRIFSNYDHENGN
jgi:hypothetical protein